MTIVKNDLKRNNKIKKDVLSDFEKIQFLQFEYDWQKQRKSDLIDRVTLFLCWNASVFVFAILFTDIEKIVALFKNCNGYYRSTLAIMLISYMILSMVILLISTLGFFGCLKVQKMMCFETERYIDGGFDIEEILTDYKEIICDYDESIENMADKVKNNIILMLIGISGLVISELVLKILVCV